MANQKSSKTTPQKGNMPPAVKKAAKKTAKKAVKQGAAAAKKNVRENMEAKPARIRRGMGCKILPYFLILFALVLAVCLIIVHALDIDDGAGALGYGIQWFFGGLFGGGNLFLRRKNHRQKTGDPEKGKFLQREIPDPAPGTGGSRSGQGRVCPPGGKRSPSDHRQYSPGSAVRSVCVSGKVFRSAFSGSGGFV